MFPIINIYNSYIYYIIRSLPNKVSLALVSVKWTSYNLSLYHSQLIGLAIQTARKDMNTGHRDFRTTTLIVDSLVDITVDKRTSLSLHKN